MVIIDTSAWVEFFRRDGDPRVKMAVKGLLDAFEGALCGPVVMEFLGGAREHERRKIEAWFARALRAHRPQALEKSGGKFR